MKKGIIFLLVTMLLILSVVGCGLSSNSASTTNTESTKNEGTKVYVGTDTAFPPFEFVDTASGQYTGFDIELLKEIAKNENLNLEFKPMEFKAIVPGLQSKTLDIGIAGMTISDERKQVVDFSEPYFQAGLVIGVKPGNTVIKSKDDLVGKTIAVKLGTSSEKLARTIKDTKVKTFDNSNDLYLEVENGGADAVIEDLPVLKYYSVKNPGKLTIIDQPMTGDFYGIAVAKGKEDLLKKINDGLKKVKDSGKYDELYKKYFGN